jgi:hypothetical protein
MEPFKILEGASHLNSGRYSTVIGEFVFIITGSAICFNYFVPSILPDKVINGMYYYLMFSVLGVISFLYQSRHNPHISSGICPKCKSTVKSTGIKCSNPDCDYEVKF